MEWSKRDLELVIGSLRMRIAVIRDLWGRRGEPMPSVLGELEELLDRCEEYMRNGGV